MRDLLHFSLQLDKKKLSIYIIMTTNPLYFVHISDTHFGPTKDYKIHGYDAYSCAQKLVYTINNLPLKPDFVIHTGDVATDPYSRAYELAAETFASLSVPIYYAVGNHDSVEGIRRHLKMGAKEELGDPSLLCYAFTAKDNRFLVVDAKGPAEIGAAGLLSEKQLALIQQEVTTTEFPLTIFMHFPILPLDSGWFDEKGLVLNGELMHQALLPMRQRLRGVFFGHIHQHMQMLRDGILYVSVASAVNQFAAWPNTADPSQNADPFPGYNFVHLLPEQTIVHHHTFPHPNS